MPSPPNAFGFAWSEDGELLASVCDEGVRVYDAARRYKLLRELEKVAPDVQGRAGGVRALYFSPKKSYLVTYEKWDPQYPENVHVPLQRAVFLSETMSKKVKECKTGVGPAGQAGRRRLASTWMPLLASPQRSSSVSNAPGLHSALRPLGGLGEALGRCKGAQRQVLRVLWQRLHLRRRAWASGLGPRRALRRRQRLHPRGARCRMRTHDGRRHMNQNIY